MLFVCCFCSWARHPRTQPHKLKPLRSPHQLTRNHPNTFGGGVNLVGRSLWAGGYESWADTPLNFARVCCFGLLSYHSFLSPLECLFGDLDKV